MVQEKKLNSRSYFPCRMWYQVGKRVFDVLACIVLLLVCAPLFLLIALAIKISSPGPVLFEQTRLGFAGRHFTMYKFRSMVSNAEQLQSELEVFNMMKGPVFKMKNDPRVTGIGKFLRKTSLDELPQLWNVLLGQMSLVGPRPLLLGELGKDDSNVCGRLSVKPGITCLWQISGRSTIIDFDKWLRLDLEYVRSCSFILDIKILFRTIPVVLSGFGAE